MWSGRRKRTAKHVEKVTCLKKYGIDLVKSVYNEIETLKMHNQEWKCAYIYTAQKKYDYMSLYASFCYADLYIIVEYGIFLKKIQFPVQRGANHEAKTIVGDTATR